MVVYLALGTVVAFVLARLFTNAATDALTQTIAAEGLRGAVRAIIDATVSDFRSWALLILIVTVVVGIVAFAWGRTRVSLPALQTDRAMERIGLALIALVVLWIAVGLEVALLAAVLLVALELVIQSRSEPSSA